MKQNGFTCIPVHTPPHEKVEQKLIEMKISGVNFWKGEDAGTFFNFLVNCPMQLYAFSATCKDCIFCPRYLNLFAKLYCVEW